MSGRRLSASEAEHEAGASALGVPAASLGYLGPRLHRSGSGLKKIRFQNDIRGDFSDCPLPPLPTCYDRTSRLS